MNEEGIATAAVNSMPTLPYRDKATGFTVTGKLPSRARARLYGERAVFGHINHVSGTITEYVVYDRDEWTSAEPWSRKPLAVLVHMHGGAPEWRSCFGPPYAPETAAPPALERLLHLIAIGA